MTAKPQDVGNPSRELLALVIVAYLPLFFIVWVALNFRGTVFSDIDVQGIVGLGLMYSALAAAELYGFARKNFNSIANWARARNWLHRTLQLSALAFVVLYGFTIAAYSALYSGFHPGSSLFGWILFFAVLLSVLDTLLYFGRKCRVVCDNDKKESRDSMKEYQSPK